MTDDRRQTPLTPRSDCRALCIALRRSARDRGFDDQSLPTAMLLASQVHSHQRRCGSGQPFVMHPLQVALLVCRWGASQADVLAAVLHDTAEDSLAGPRAILGRIADLFGEAVSLRVSALTKNRGITDPEARGQDHTARLLAAVRDLGPGVAAIRLADRLHNCVTSAHFAAERLQRMHTHTELNVTPLARRLRLPALAEFLAAAPQAWHQVGEARFVPAMLGLQAPWLGAAGGGNGQQPPCLPAWPVLM